jgi:hypothetical protein
MLTIDWSESVKAPAFSLSAENVRPVIQSGATGIESMTQNYPAVVHQATGIVSVQLQASVQEALFTLESRAVLENRPLLEIARDVVERRIRFDN